MVSEKFPIHKSRMRIATLKHLHKPENNVKRAFAEM